MNVADDRPILSINGIKQFLPTSADLTRRLFCKNDQPNQFWGVARPVIVGQ